MCSSKKRDSLALQLEFLECRRVLISINYMHTQYPLMCVEDLDEDWSGVKENDGTAVP